MEILSHWYSKFMPILRKREVVYGFTVVNSKPGSKLSDERIIRQVDLNERKRTPGEKKKPPAGKTD